MSLGRSPSLDDRLRAGFIGGVGVAILLTVYFGWHPPAQQALVPVEGPLVSYDLDHVTGRGARRFLAFSLGGHPETFINTGLAGKNSGRLAGKLGARIKVFYDPGQPPLRLDREVIQTYGLEINDVVVESAEDDVSSVRLYMRTAAPLVALGMIALGAWRFATVRPQV